MTTEMTLRRWLLTQAMMEGLPWWVAQEAVSSVALEHPEWDMDELVDERGQRLRG